jgi:transcription elongation GreA/GreB family factor
MSKESTGTAITASEAPATNELHDRVLELAKHGEAADLLEVWPEICANPPQDQEFYSQLVRSRATTYDPEAVHGLLSQLLDGLEQAEDWQIVIRVVDAAASSWPDSDRLRSAIYPALAGKYSDYPNAAEMISLCRIEEGAPLDQALKRFRSFLRLSPGRAYLHATWGVGVISNLDLKTGKVTLDFPAEKGRVLTLAGVRDFLSYLPPSHFLAVRATEPERLTSIADESPAELVKLALESHKGRMKQGDLKTMLLNGVLAEERWNSWWTRARAELRLDPLIDFDTKGGAHAEIVLRSKPRTFEAELQDLFLGPEADLTSRIGAVKNVQSAQTGTAQAEVSPDLLRRMLKALNDDYRLKSGSMSRTERLQAALLAEDLRSLNPELKDEPGSIPPATQLLGEFEGSYDDLANVEHPDHAARALKMLMERDKDHAYELAARLFPKAPSRLAQVIWRALDPEHHRDLAIQAVQELFMSPLANPQTFLWSVKQMADGNWAHLSDYFPASWLAQELLDGLDAWESLMGRPSVDKTTQANAKLLVSRIKSQMEQNHFQILCAAVEEMTIDQAKRLRKSVQHNNAMPDAYRSQADRYIVLTRRDLEEEKAAGSGQPGELLSDGLHFCTTKARGLKLNELNELNTVKIPNNSKEIEKARSEGDLKENAGYIYAKEQQKLLMQASVALQESLQTARVFDKAKVNTLSIGFGVQFDAQNLKKNSQETYTVLGRFETDPDLYIISYQSPFMSQFLGKKVGEEFTVKHPDGGETPYKILAIRDALASGDWDATEGLKS